ncbi:MAG: hypothetical protein ACSHYA_01050 [Opitutaceae bacterium]
MNRLLSEWRVRSGIAFQVSPVTGKRLFQIIFGYLERMRCRLSLAQVIGLVFAGYLLI